MVTVRDFLKHQTHLHSTAIRDLKDKANKTSYMKPSLPEWRAYKAHKKQCSLALAALWIEKTENGNPSLSKNINGKVELYGVPISEARKFIEHIRTNVLNRKGLANRIYMNLEVPEKSLEERFRSICNDEVHELAPGLMEVSLKALQEKK